MHNPEKLSAVQAFGQRNLPALQSLLTHADDAVWTERLRTWLTACILSPDSALRAAALEHAVVDLVTLELSRQSYALADDGLRLTDQGGTLLVRRTLAELLFVLSTSDARSARQLATLACASRNERLEQIRSKIIETV
ncbi:hypothetical protein B6V73_19320 [Thioclava sp. JM3]|uniref:hypothetical protein n=1 Tax=Thioclava sp. JM3 TaxID=1973004 RepID=UPI000B540DD7|nr:hypothetical protein [Thioclava sp. JM3]OWY10435.1 hypothetical protein B6V73_19320 [Thioclava sp. JM3]